MTIGSIVYHTLGTVNISRIIDETVPWIMSFKNATYRMVLR